MLWWAVVSRSCRVPDEADCSGHVRFTQRHRDAWPATQRCGRSRVLRLCLRCVYLWHLRTAILTAGADQPQLTAMLTSLLAPSLAHKRSNTSSDSSNTPSTPMQPQSTSSESHTTYVRMITDLPQSRPSSSKGHHKMQSHNSGSSSGSGSSGSDVASPRTVIWEIRAHATGVEGADLPAFGLGGSGTMVPQTTGDEMKGKAIWLMGRRIGEGLAEGEGNGQK